VQARDKGEHHPVGLHRLLCGDWDKQPYVAVSSRKKKTTNETSPFPDGW